MTSLFIVIVSKNAVPGGADGSRTDADLDNVGAGQQQLLHHLARHHIALQESKKKKKN
jgi:hypothetical protein